MKLPLHLAIAGAVLGLASVSAQAAPPAATPVKAATAKSTAPRGPAKPRTAKSLSCSKDADGKNLHGAARNAFMRSCNK